ncbi:hypothetical protein B0T16DRAFT_370193 [Cercophora newfieldiana]|uniref:Rhodopsin domain-containing protein n=1 Tax=Cercophora newfieldiana TaxID=92897 RepID=A0AA39YIF1_9PEZI|nr:hypothetical protein B0T16DRAFT_370193 [Cercophora newfieldiana]
MSRNNITVSRNRADAFVIVPQYGPYPYSELQIVGFVILGTFPALSLITCGLRVYSRQLVGGFAADDWLIFFALFLAIPQAIFTSFFLRGGYWGIHDSDIPPEVPPNLGGFWNFMTGLCANPTLGIVKASALLFLVRLGGIKRRVLISCRVLITLNLAHMVTFFTVFLFQCWPIQSRWMGGGSAKCLRVEVLSLTMASLSIVTDFLTLAVPFALFLNLRVSKRMRNALLTVFLLGGIVTIMSIVRLYYIIRLNYLHPEDRHYSIGFVCSCVELNLAIITASVPALWPLGRRWFPRAFASLGIDRPHCYPDIEIVSVTSGLGQTPKVYKSKIVWRDKGDSS